MKYCRSTVTSLFCDVWWRLNGRCGTTKDCLMNVWEAMKWNKKSICFGRQWMQKWHIWDLISCCISLSTASWVFSVISAKLSKVTTKSKWNIFILADRICFIVCVDDLGKACSTHRRDEKCTQNLGRNLKGKDHLENPGVDGKIILQWILGKWDGKVWTPCIWLRIGTRAGFCKHGKEPKSSMKGGEFLDYLSYC